MSLLDDFYSARARVALGDIEPGSSGAPHREIVKRVSLGALNRLCELQCVQSDRAARRLTAKMIWKEMSEPYVGQWKAGTPSLPYSVALFLVRAGTFSSIVRLGNSRGFAYDVAERYTTLVLYQRRRVRWRAALEKFYEKMRNRA